VHHTYHIIAQCQVPFSYLEPYNLMTTISAGVKPPAGAFARLEEVTLSTPPLKNKARVITQHD
jgi:hypothetical protein